MTRDDVIKLAREAGFITGNQDMFFGYGKLPIVQSAGSTFLVELERFAELVATAERESIKVIIQSELGKKMDSLGVEHLVALFDAERKANSKYGGRK